MTTRTVRVGATRRGAARWRSAAVRRARVACTAAPASLANARPPPQLAGQHRWVEYEGNKNFYMVDASFIAPEWHSWLHHMVEEVPTRVRGQAHWGGGALRGAPRGAPPQTAPALACRRAPQQPRARARLAVVSVVAPPRPRLQTTIGNAHKTPPLANSAGSSAPYARNLGGVIAAPTPNLSQFRPRGYGLGNEVFPESKPDEELYYTQPGWPLDKRNARVAPSGRKARMPFSLRDTPLTIKARAAAKHGMSVAAYERFSDPWSSSRVAALVAGPRAHGGAEGDGALDAEQRDALAEALPGAELPADAAQARVVAALVAGDGVPRDAPGTFAAAVGSVLTPEEEELLGRGLDASELVAQAAGYQDMIDRYAGGAGGKVRRVCEVSCGAGAVCDERAARAARCHAAPRSHDHSPPPLLPHLPLTPPRLRRRRRGAWRARSRRATACWRRCARCAACTPSSRSSRRRSRPTWPPRRRRPPTRRRGREGLGACSGVCSPLSRAEVRAQSDSHRETPLAHFRDSATRNRS